jgi:signal transduction histidine kinase
MACRMESLRELERDALISRMQSEVSQSLDILKRGLETLAGNHQAELAPAIKAQLEELAREADAGMEAVRSAIFEMRPPGVQDLGFTGAVERYATEQAAAAGIALSLSLPQQALPVGMPTLESLYVVARTGIDNVIRHAHAKHLNISVIHDHKEIMLKVVDDGVGISDKDLMKDSAYSLFAASERLGTSGGELRVTGTPGRGTTLEATISLQHSRKSLRHNVTPLRVA